MIRYCASWLPVIRDHLVKEGRHAASLGLSEGPMYEDIVRGFYNEMDTLSNAPLYWVSGDMETLVCDTLTNGPLPPVRLLPASTGFMCFEKSIIVVDHHDGRTVPVDGVSWEMYLGASGTVDDAELSVRCYSRSPEFLASVSDKSLPLGPVANMTDGLSHDVGAIVNVVFALMMQPSVSSVADSMWDRRRDGVMPGKASSWSRVKIVTLREPPKRASHDGDGSREYTCRWIVRGHYRNQAYGPNHSLRRLQWIPPYVAGPVGLPLEVKDTVHVWRRL